MVGKNGVAVTSIGACSEFALGISLATAIIFGLFPALHGSRTELNSVLKDSGGRASTGLHHNKARAVLVLAEVSLAVVLVIGSALLIRSFLSLYGVNPGFDIAKRAHDERYAVVTEVRKDGRRGRNGSHRSRTDSFATRRPGRERHLMSSARRRHPGSQFRCHRLARPSDFRPASHRLGNDLAQLLRGFQNSSQAWSRLQLWRERQIARRRRDQREHGH